MNSINFYIFQQINGIAGQYYWLDFAGIFCAEYLEYVLIFCLFLFLIKNFKKYWQMVFQAFSAGIIARLFFTEIIRWILPKPRPFVENNVNLLISHSSSPSFPSGHASFYFALSSIIYFYNKKLGCVFLFASFLICLGRVFCGIHWLFDIFAGALLGIFTGFFVVKFFQRYLNN